MFTVVTSKSKIITCQKRLVKNKVNYSLVFPSELNNLWFKKNKEPLLDKPRILYVGRVKVEKGIFSLLSILEKLKYNLILSIAGSMQVYEPFLIMTQGSPANSTKTLVMHIVDVGLDYYKLGPSAAMGTILMIILIIITSMKLSILRKDKK